jgi:hypothetical protein
MKKLTGILMILLLATGVFGQINLGDRSPVEQYNWQRTTNLAHFTTTVNEKTHYYILAYEPNYPDGCFDDTDRSVYLYCIEVSGSRWLKVSDAVMTNHFEDINNYVDVDFFLYNEHTQNSSHSYVTEVGYDRVFTLDVHTKVNGGVTVTSQSFTLELKERRFIGNYYTLKND